MNFLKKLFGRREKKIVISYGDLPHPHEVLTPEQLEGAVNFYADHKEHIQKIMKEVNVACDVSLEEDKNEPMLWKPGHWLWFFDKIDENFYNKD